MKTGRPKGPEKILYRKRVTPEMARKLDCVAIGERAEPVMPVSGSEPSKFDDRVKRLQDELETCDRARQEAAKQIQERQDEIVRLKEERKAENDPSLPARENIALRKKIQALTEGILKDAEKIDRMERLLAVMVEWDLPTFESWKIAKQNELMNKKHEVADVDQEAGT
jgi:hypothetical protein